MRPSRSIIVRKNNLRYGRLFGVDMFVGGYESILEYIDNAQLPVSVAYGHFDVLMRCRTDEKLRSLLSGFSLTYPDGVGARFAFRVLQGPPVARINATDLNHRLLHHCIERSYRIAMVGALPGTINRLRMTMHHLGVPDDRLLIRHGYLGIDDQDTVGMIRSFAPDVLFIGMGTPRQFEWYAAHAALELAPRIVLTGGFFEILSGTKRRAPAWMQYLGLEWVHRLMLEPGRLWKRYILGIPHFLVVLAAMKLRFIKR
jgi:N-acetylglucosaminyldiphosphoundecaprenol N-acetyl-beta-D-mannosaminyltransferase